MVEITETLYARDREACVTYDQAVEEALCFGWIDSILKRIDEEKHCWRFTPRKNTKRWSNLNRRRFRKMIEQGRMTQAGLGKVHPTVDIDRDDTPTGIRHHLMTLPSMTRMRAVSPPLSLETPTTERSPSLSISEVCSRDMGFSRGVPKCCSFPSASCRENCLVV